MDDEVVEDEEDEPEEEAGTDDEEAEAEAEEGMGERESSNGAFFVNSVEAERRSAASVATLPALMPDQKDTKP